MEKEYDVYDIIVQLRKGEKILCKKCNKGYYVTNVDPKYLSMCKEFNCDHCGSHIKIIPNVIVD